MIFSISAKNTRMRKKIHFLTKKYPDMNTNSEATTDWILMKFEVQLGKYKCVF